MTYARNIINNHWEYPKCNYCGKNNYKVLWNKVKTWITDGEFRIVKCINCNFVYLSPRPKKQYIINYYPPETYWGLEIVNSKNRTSSKERDAAYGFLYNQILKKKKIGNILDLGAGTGLFLSKFIDLHWGTYGVELSKEACDYAKKVYGLNLITGSFPEVKLPTGAYDVITLNGCLEHLYQPKESLIKIHKLLNKDGIVEITVPNFNSLGKLIFGKHWYALQPPSHLYHYTPDTITNMLKHAGFRSIEINHNYRKHNLYILFESLRLSFSPKFKGNNITSFINTEPISNKNILSIKTEIGKYIAKITTLVLATIEPIVKKGEVITIYAKKY
jgi:2-polyprenyl-3-methyl-5-hydroxy-6-metoxy-1,4-benzoquinol methylase